MGSFNPVAGLTWGHNIQQLERELCSKMPMIKFSYFDIEAKGELTRLLLHAGNFDFEDDRLPISSWPGEHKEKTTFGQLPMLSWDGVELAQSMAIATSNFLWDTCSLQEGPVLLAGLILSLCKR